MQRIGRAQHQVEAADVDIGEPRIGRGEVSRDRGASPPGIEICQPCLRVVGFEVPGPDQSREAGRDLCSREVTYGEGVRPFHAEAIDRGTARIPR